MKVLQKRKKFKSNKINIILLQFILWIVLLWISLNYMNNTPAERTSLYSGLSVMYQRVEIFFLSKFGSIDKEIAESKFSMERTYKALIDAFETSSCWNKEDYNYLLKTYDELKNIKIKDFESKTVYFWTILWDISWNFNKECDNKV